MFAVVRNVSVSISDCELTFLARDPINYDVARRQHEGYVSALRSHGAAIRYAPDLPLCPDAVFVEDTAVVTDEVAVLATMGSSTREPEVDNMEGALAEIRRIERIALPARLEGGDVLRIGRRCFVGLSARTNALGIAALRSALEPFGYTITAVPVERCLHLKTGVTYLGDGRLLCNPRWVDASIFGALDVVSTHEREPFAANALRVGDVVLFPSGFPETERRLRSAGCSVETIDISEFLKAEAGLTCLSIVIDASHT